MFAPVTAYGSPNSVPKFRVLPAAGSQLSADGEYFDFRSLAGESTEGAVRVINLDDDPLKLSLYPADTETSPRGGIAIATRRGEAPSFAGAWIRLGRSEVALGPGESGLIRFELEVPDSAFAGEYTAAIVAEGPPRQRPGPFGNRLVSRAAVTLLVAVPGRKTLSPELEIAALKPDVRTRSQAVIASLSNLGGSNLAGAAGRLVIRGAAGAIQREIPVELGYFLAWDTISHRIFIEPELAAGTYSLTLSLEYGEHFTEKTESLFLGRPVRLPGIPADPEPEAAEPPAGSSPWIVVGLGLSGLLLMLVSLLAAAGPRWIRLWTKR